MNSHESLNGHEREGCETSGFAGKIQEMILSQALQGCLLRLECNILNMVRVMVRVRVWNMAGAPKTLSFFLLCCLIYIHARKTVQQESQRNGDNRKESIFALGLYQLQCKYKRILKCKIARDLGKATNLKRSKVLRKRWFHYCSCYVEMLNLIQGHNATIAKFRKDPYAKDTCFYA